MATVEKVLKDLIQKYDGEIGHYIFNVNLIGVVAQALDNLIGMDELKDKVGELLSDAIEEITNKEFEEKSSN